MKLNSAIAARLAAGVSALTLLVACTGNERAITPATYADDAGTTARVRIALMRHPQWREADLQITTEGGVVRITGNAAAESAQPKAELQALVQKVDGVQATAIDLD